MRELYPQSVTWIQQRFLRNLSLRTDDRRTDACATTVALLIKSSKAKNREIYEEQQNFCKASNPATVS